MRKFLLNIFASLLLTICVLVISSVVLTFIFWDYTWIFTDAGLTSIRIGVIVIFILVHIIHIQSLKKKSKGI